MSDTRSQIKTMKVSAKTDEMVGRGVGKTAHTQVQSKWITPLVAVVVTVVVVAAEAGVVVLVVLVLVSSSRYQTASAL